MSSIDNPNPLGTLRSPEHPSLKPERTESARLLTRCGKPKSLSLVCVLHPKPQNPGLQGLDEGAILTSQRVLGTVLGYGGILSQIIIVSPNIEPFILLYGYLGCCGFGDFRDFGGWE